MTINIELTAQEIDALKQATKIENDAEAIAKAVREYLRLCRLHELTAISGKVELNDNWQELGEWELSETDFPQ